MCKIWGKFTKKRVAKVSVASLLVAALLAGICIGNDVSLFNSKADSVSKKDVLSAVREARKEVLYEKSHEMFTTVDIDEDKLEGEELCSISDDVCTPKLISANKKCGVDAVRENPDFGYKGDETVVAVIDTGVNYKHNDMVISNDAKSKFTEDEWKKRVSSLGYGRYYSEKVPYGYDYINNQNECLSTTDDYHGYHVAGIIGGNGVVSGVAPNAQLLSMNALGGSVGGTTDPLVRSIEDAVTLGADVINMSLGSTSGLTTDEDYVQKAVDTATNKGVLVCIAAGNDGTSAGFGGSYIDMEMTDIATLNSPGAAKQALTVAAADVTTSDTTMAYFTSWGSSNDLAIKPEISAPGVNVNAAYKGNGYEILSGTSMATPYVSGCATLVINDVKKNNISLDGKPLEGKALVSYIKANLMNTSTPIEDVDNYSKGKGIPYSVRRQGAGLVNAENALKNRVIATCNDEAKIELGEVSNKGKTFEIKLTNYGDTDVTYNVESSDVYRNVKDAKTTAIINDGAASISFDKCSVVVPAKGSVTVVGTLKISSAYPENRFVEAYVQFTGEDVVNLSMPVLGFYGSWTAEPLIDYPIYDGQESYLESIGAEAVSIDGAGVSGDGKLRSGTGLMEYDKANLNQYLGTVVKGDKVEYISELCAFSPDKNYVRDMVSVGVTNIRSIKELKMSILDENKELVRTVGIVNDIRKKSYIDLCSSPYSMLQYLYQTVGDDLVWDGTVYDKGKNKYVPAKDGQYYVQLEAKISEKFAPQIITMPVKIDTKAPTITDYSVDANKKIKLKLEENLAMDSYYYVYADGEVTPFAMDMAQINEEGDYQFDLSNFDGDELWLVLNDIAGNEVTKKIKTKKLDSEEEIVSYDAEEAVEDDFNFEAIFDNSIIEKTVVLKEKNTTSVLLKDGQLDKIEFDIKPKDGFTFKNIYIEAEKVNDTKIIDESNVSNITEDEVISDDAIDDNIVISEEDILADDHTNNNTLEDEISEEEYYECYDYEDMMGNFEKIEGTENADGSYHFVLDSSVSWRFLSVYGTSNTTSQYYLNLNIHSYDKENEFYEDLSYNESDALSGDYEGEYITDKELNDDGTYTFKGKFMVYPDVFKINNQDVAVNKDTLEFSVKVPMKGGINVANIYVKNKYRDYEIEKKWIRSEFKVTLDNIKDESKVIKCDSDTFNLKGMIESYITGYTIRINNNIMYSSSTYYDVVAGRRDIDTKKFDYNINLKEGVNEIKLEVTNHRGEVIKKILNIEKVEK